jgi:hypothetical protein
MTAIGNSKYSIGGAVDFLLSASATLYLVRKNITGLYKISVVASRGIDAALKVCRFDTSQKDTWAHYAASFVPAKVSAVFEDKNPYDELKTEKQNLPVIENDKVKKNAKGEIVKEMQDVEVYKFSNRSLILSGVALAVVSLLALELKHALWRPAHPILNDALSYISPFQAILGKSWIANGINHAVGFVRTTAKI